MKKTVVKKVKREILNDIICDICGGSCLIEEGVINNKLKLDCGEKYGIFEYLLLTADWGYGSGKDGERWEAHVCASCADKHLIPIIKFQIKHT